MAIYLDLILHIGLGVLTLTIKYRRVAFTPWKLEKMQKNHILA